MYHSETRKGTDAMPFPCAMMAGYVQPLSECVSIIAGENHALCRWAACDHALAWSLVTVERDATNGGLSFLLDFLFGFGSAVPVCENEPALLDFLLELVVGVGSGGF